MVRSQRRLFGTLVACAAIALALLFPVEGRSATTIGDAVGPASTTTQDATTLQDVVRVNRPWVCRRHVNIDLVKVTMRTNRSHAIYLRPGCSGRIGRIQVDTWTQDGVTVNRGRGRMPAHDLVIGNGYIYCHNHLGGHQDGVQVMDGRRIVFRSMEIKCGSNNNRATNSQFYVSGNRPYVPRRVVCIACVLGTGAASPLFIDLSVDSGARRSTVCRGRFGYAVRIERSVAIRPVHSGLRILGSTNPLCHR